MIQETHSWCRPDPLHHPTFLCDPLKDEVMKYTNWTILWNTNCMNTSREKCFIQHSFTIYSAIYGSDILLLSLWYYAFVIAYLLESSLARFKNVACCFQTISCLLSFKKGNKWISSATCLFLPYEREQEVHKCMHPKYLQVSSSKISNVGTKKLLKYRCRHYGTYGNHK